MDISITDELPYDYHNIYDVHFYSDNIQTLVTHDPQQLAGWISEIESIHNQHTWWRRLIVGLDIEWRTSFSTYRNPVAIIQLCVDRRCVVFQVLKYGAVFNNTGGIPIELEQFLGNESYTFVGVGIGNDAEKLNHDYGVPVGDVETLQRNYGVLVGGAIVDLARLAAKAYRDDQLRFAGIKKLASLILGKDVEKPKSLGCGPWDNSWLTPRQVQYACLDAFLSFEIGNRLTAYL